MDIVIPMVFPEYAITVVERPHKIDLFPGVEWDDFQIPRTKVRDLGHAGVLIVNGRTGFTKYYEYGRYGGPRGRVRNVSVPNVSIPKPGMPPTRQSLAHVMRRISSQSGQSGRIKGAYIVVGDTFATMRKTAEAKMRDQARPDYDLLSNNCLHFAIEVAESGGARMPRSINPTPSHYVDDMFENFPDLEYDYRAQKLRVEGIHE